jgi:hypothetical protein
MHSFLFHEICKFYAGIGTGTRSTRISSIKGPKNIWCRLSRQWVPSNLEWSHEFVSELSSFLSLNVRNSPSRLHHLGGIKGSREKGIGYPILPCHMSLLVDKNEPMICDNSLDLVLGKIVALHQWRRLIGAWIALYRSHSPVGSSYQLLGLWLPIHIFGELDWWIWICSRDGGDIVLRKWKITVAYSWTLSTVPNCETPEMTSNIIVCETIICIRCAICSCRGCDIHAQLMINKACPHAQKKRTFV